MREVVDEIIRSYGLMVSQTEEELQQARMRVTEFLKDQKGTPRELSIEGLRFLRGDKPYKKRGPFIVDAEDAE